MKEHLIGPANLLAALTACIEKAKRDDLDLLLSPDGRIKFLRRDDSSTITPPSPCPTCGHGKVWLEGPDPIEDPNLHRSVPHVVPYCGHCRKSSK